MASGDTQPAPPAWLVFWLGFLITFAGIWGNIAAVHVLPDLIDRQQVTEPADDAQVHEPLFA